MQSILFILAVAYTWFSFREMFEHVLSVWKSSRCEVGCTLRSRLIHTGKEFISNLLSCPKCLTYWVGLVLSQSIVIAAASSLLYDLIHKLKDRI